MKIYKRSTIFKTQSAYFIPIFFGLLYSFLMIPFYGEGFKTSRDILIIGGLIVFFVTLLGWILYLMYSSLRYIILHDEYIEFLGALPPVRATKYCYSDIVKCVIHDYGHKTSEPIFDLYTNDDKRHYERIYMVRESTLREIADELMSHGITVESTIKLQ